MDFKDSQGAATYLAAVAKKFTHCFSNTTDVVLSQKISNYSSALMGLKRQQSFQSFSSFENSYRELKEMGHLVADKKKADSADSTESIDEAVRYLAQNIVKPAYFKESVKNRDLRR